MSNTPTWLLLLSRGTCVATAGSSVGPRRGEESFVAVPSRSCFPRVCPPPRRLPGLCMADSGSSLRVPLRGDLASLPWYVAMNLNLSCMAVDGDVRRCVSRRRETPATKFGQGWSAGIATTESLVGGLRCLFLTAAPVEPPRRTCVSVAPLPLNEPPCCRDVLKTSGRRKTRIE